MKTLDQLKGLENKQVIWFHCASLGEFEQGRPIIEKVRTQYPKYKIVLSFFSPSGFEIRKEYDKVDIVTYLPLDTKANMKLFIERLNPKVAVIIKYEFWPNLLRELKNKNIKTILVSAKFRKKQAFFSFFGSWLRKSLKTFDHFFVQDQNSKLLLKSIKFDNVTVSGDTRFDRVHQIVGQDNALDFVKQFSQDKITIVAGSTWSLDELLIVNYINKSISEEKWIIAPHNINQKQIKELQNSISKKVVLYSDKEAKNLANYDVLIIDTIGLLTKVYSNADIAYVGGGLATGLHNILEPATFGIPVIFGAHKHQKFQEAIDLIKQNGCKEIENQKEFNLIMNSLIQDSSLRSKMGAINATYVKNNIGATHKIMNYITMILNE